MRMISFRIIMTLIFIPLLSCESLSQREQDILEYSPDKVRTYEDRLVDLETYTTKGRQYHQKYKKHLIGIAQFMTEKKKLPMVKKSIGFYFDKKANIKSRLYLGVDIQIPINENIKGRSYNDSAVILLRRYLKDVLYVLFSCRTIFSEKEIVGVVIGFHWGSIDVNEMVNIWIDEKDVLMYEKGMLTLKEILERNVITNTKGNIIRLRG